MIAPKFPWKICRIGIPLHVKPQAARAAQFHPQVAKVSSPLVTGKIWA
jgi:hypothetical protein